MVKVYKGLIILNIMTIVKHTYKNKLVNEKRNKSYLAIQLSISRSIIPREINNWLRKPGDKYDAHLAHWYTQDDNNSKRIHDKMTLNPQLKITIF